MSTALGFGRRTAKHNLYPAWEQTTLHQTGEPHPEAPCHWRWEAIEPLIEESIRETATKNSERRVLMLGNPAYASGIGDAATTQSLQGGIQVLAPGESARPHRHTPNALRFMLEDGGETYTVVDGKECLMERGDVILTPALTWHSHHHKGTGRSVWFDALDSQLVSYFDAGFFEPGTKLSNLPSTIPDECFVEAGLTPVLPDVAPWRYSPRFRYPWSKTLAALDAAPVRSDGSTWLRFTNPAGGEMAMPPMDAYMVRLGRTKTQAHRMTAGAICVVASGSGVSTCGSDDIHWKERDIFTVPHWAWATHRAESTNAVLFVVTDRGVLEKLGLLREEFV